MDSSPFFFATSSARVIADNMAMRRAASYASAVKLEPKTERGAAPAAESDPFDDGYGVVEV